MRRSIAIALLFSCAAAACGEEVAMPQRSQGPVRRAAKGPAAAASGAGSAAPPAVDFQESSFAESERSRDPFRSYADMFAEQAKSRVRSQRQVVLDQYSVQELRLIGIVTRAYPARAMLVDPTGKGHVVKRGQFVGRAEIVQGGATGAEYEINWRVDRIRDGDIVLVREDPTNPDVPSATKVIPLRPEGALIDTN